MFFLCGSLCRLLLAALCGPLCGGPFFLCGPLCGSPRRLLLAACCSAFLRHSFSVICLSFAASAAVLSHKAHQPQRPRAALQASTRAAPVPGSTGAASQPPWGGLGGRQERASVAQRVLGVKVRQSGFSGPLVSPLEAFAC